MFYTYFFYKQSVYKQLTLGWQIAKQLPGFNWSFSFIINIKKAVKLAIHQNSAVSKALGKL